MKARIRIETAVDVDRKDYRALESAGPAELVQTAQMQGAKISVSVEKARKPAEKKADATQAAPSKEEGDGQTDGTGGGI